MKNLKTTETVRSFAFTVPNIGNNNILRLLIENYFKQNKMYWHNGCCDISISSRENKSYIYLRYVIPISNYDHLEIKKTLVAMLIRNFELWVTE